MGDRGNIAVRQHDGGVIYLYTHWGGSGCAQTLRNALAKRWRWGDEAYLTRIIFDQMEDDGLFDHGEETGGGIATRPCDNEHTILCVDGMRVTIIDEQGGELYPGWSFEEFLNLDLGQTLDR